MSAGAEDFKFCAVLARLCLPSKRGLVIFFFPNKRNIVKIEMRNVSLMRSSLREMGMFSLENRRSQEIVLLCTTA